MKPPPVVFRALLVLILGLVPEHASPQFQPFAPVHGQLIDNRSGRPVPGLMVSLIHPALGRSAPAFTDPIGRFGWSAIPLRPEPYFLEVYWGQNLIYRQPIQVRGPLFLPPMRI